MKKNVGTVDKWIRIVLGVAILSMLVWVQGDLKWLGLIGLIPLITAFMGFCPLYLPFGISTNKSEKK
ncbi:MAG: DUF2892 domain-containing protein [Eubacteriales bacterium]|nr:DUF2892 domain-containing protein [Eubacteriales bacterium]